MHGFSALEDNDLSNPSLVLLKQSVAAGLREVEVLRQSRETVQSIVKVNGDLSHRLHRVEADAQQRKHEIDLFDSDRLILVGIKECDSSHHENRQQEQGDVVVGDIAVEDVMIVVLLNEQVIILLHDEVFPSDYLG